jgi:beta-glucanase (GH16 family)
MKRNILALCLLFSLLISGCDNNRNDIPKPTPHSFTDEKGLTWKLVWSDEFNYNGLPDPEKWDYEVGYIRNNELQYYTQARKENARVEDGFLVIEARKEKFEDYGFTSASLITKGRNEWIHGRIEVKAVLPAGVGMWPAIWMLGTNIEQKGWPLCGEIDIMENVGFEPDTIHGTVHTEAYNHLKGTQRGAAVNVPGVSDSSHVYAIEWTTDKIDFFVDDANYFSFANDGKDETTWPFDNEFYLIMNIAIGGAWGGQRGVDESIFPQKMMVDYVRVYQTAP